MYGKGKHGCPRGFHWCEKKQECVPEGTEVKNVLKKENERYFFKEGKIMDTDKLVDEVFDGGFGQFGKIRTAEKQIDMLLEELEEEVDFGKGSISTTGRPYDHPIKAKVVPSIDGKAEVAVDECAGPMMNEEKFEGSEYDKDAPAKEDNPQKIANVINTVPNQNVGGLLKSIHKQLAEMRINEDYKAYFKSMLKKHGYDSPANIPADKKKEFFNAVDSGWKGKGEVKEAVSEGMFDKETRIKKLEKRIANRKEAYKQAEYMNKKGCSQKSATEIIACKKKSFIDMRSNKVMIHRYEQTLMKLKQK